MVTTRKDILHILIACIWILRQCKASKITMRILILPVWQIPFDSPYFVPVTLQNSWSSHTAVSLHKTVIFGNFSINISSKWYMGYYEVYFDIQHMKSLTVLTAFSNMIHGTVAIEKSCISYASSIIFTWRNCTRICSKKMGLNSNIAIGNKINILSF